jgi:DNA mismatch repair protein MSH5
VAASGGFFQIRPQKDFRPERGRNNLLSLGLLSDLPGEILDAPDLDASLEPRNAYEFMQRRRITGDDPTLRRWNASIRMSNFAALDMSPFAVGPLQPFRLVNVCMNHDPIAGFDRRIARPSH